VKPSVTPEQIDAVLPQTQCGLCSYGGCMPYAEAMIFEKAAINLCPPGGVETLQQLGSLLSQDPSPYITEMGQKTKAPSIAIIREDECIGCTKCIEACPVDAILGGPKLMHTVITAECTGCELCVAPCPVDCIDIKVVETELDKDKARKRFNARNNRLDQQARAEKEKKAATSLSEKKNYIQDAIKRAKARA
jgi:electron transport complex protein RnfB